MNPLRAALHAHSTYCDGTVSTEEMILEAIEQEYLSIGISSHSPLPFENDYAMTAKAERQYLDEMDQLKEKYREEIEILTGLEWDNDTPEGFVPFQRYDYFIGSVHQLIADGKPYAIDYKPEDFEACLNIGFGGNWEKMVQAYFDALVHCVSRPQVDIVGHFDLLRKLNQGSRYFYEESTKYRKIAQDALDRVIAARPDVIFEVNFGGMAKYHLASPYPESEWMHYLHKKGMRITIQADAHTKEALSRGWEDAIAYAKDTGFDSVYRMRADRIWERVRI